MSSLQPPFANRSEYAAALVSLVRDDRVGRPDEAFVVDAVEQFSDDIPVIATSDIGDGSKKEWELGKTGEEFADWDFGFSEDRKIRVQRLSSSAPAAPPEYLRNDGVQYRIDERTVASVQTLYLVFLDAPAATTSQHRVEWHRIWTVDASTNEVRANYQMGLVYLACKLKCEGLAADYARTRSAASDFIETSSKVDEYRQLAADFERKYRKAIKRRGARLTHGKVRTGRVQIFGRGYA